MKNIYLLLFLLGFSFYGQFINNGVLFVKGDGLLTVDDDFLNDFKGNVINQGEIVLTKNFFNDGGFNFKFQGSPISESSGKLSFAGKGEQVVSGNSPLILYDVEFAQKTANQIIPITLSVFINHKANFITGFVENSKPIVFEANAFQENASDASFARGTIEKRGKTSFTFPIGGSLYRPISIENFYHNRTISARYIEENSNLKYNHSRKQRGILYIDENEYWLLSNDKGQEEEKINFFINPSSSSFKVSNSNSNNLLISFWNKGKWGFKKDPIVDNSIKSLGFNVNVLNTPQPFALGIVARPSIKINNGLSPNGDGLNDFVYIRDIEHTYSNKFNVFNASGIKVFEIDNYNNNDRAFKGVGNVNGFSTLPMGTYYYALIYKTVFNETQTITGFIYMK